LYSLVIVGTLVFPAILCPILDQSEGRNAKETGLEWIGLQWDGLEVSKTKSKSKSLEEKERKGKIFEALAGRGRGLHEHVLSFMPPRDTAQCPLTNYFTSAVPRLSLVIFVWFYIFLLFSTPSPLSSSNLRGQQHPGWTKGTLHMRGVFGTSPLCDGVLRIAGRLLWRSLDGWGVV
jgi:hypothetical protein